MKTEDLIAQLAAEPAGKSLSVERLAMAAVLAGVLVTGVMFSIYLGPRPGLLAALGEPVVLAKTVLPLVLGVVALVLSLRAARPGTPPGRLARLVWAVPAAAAALFLWAFAVTPPAERLRDFLGHSIPVCLPFIVLLSLPMLAGLMAAVSKGAPVRPVRTGALVGFAAAGIACAFYSTFCTEDTPLFYAVWYSLGISISAGLGALVGSRVLRW